MAKFSNRVRAWRRRMARRSESTTYDPATNDPGTDNPGTDEAPPPYTDALLPGLAQRLDTQHQAETHGSAVTANLASVEPWSVTVAFCTANFVVPRVHALAASRGIADIMAGLTRALPLVKAVHQPAAITANIRTPSANPAQPRTYEAFFQTLLDMLSSLAASADLLPVMVRKPSNPTGIADEILFPILANLRSAVIAAPTNADRGIIARWVRNAVSNIMITLAPLPDDRIPAVAAMYALYTGRLASAAAAIASSRKVYSRHNGVRGWKWLYEYPQTQRVIL